MSNDDVRDPASAGRREFFLVGCAAVGLASAGFVVNTFRYLVPTVLYEPPARFTIGDTPKIYSITRDGKQVKVVGVGCKNGGFYVIDAADGKILWRREFTSTIHTKHKMNSYASCTPTVDAERVYVAWTAPEEYTLMALDHEGNDVWHRNLGPFVSQHSGGTSPIIYQDMVIIGNEQGDEDANGISFLAAFDRRTG